MSVKNEISGVKAELAAGNGSMNRNYEILFLSKRQL